MADLSAIVQQHKGFFGPFGQGAHCKTHVYMAKGGCAGYAAAWIKMVKTDGGIADLTTLQSFEDVQWVMSENKQGRDGMKQYLTGCGVHEHSFTSYKSEIRFDDVMNRVVAQSGYYVLGISSDFPVSGHALAFRTAPGPLGRMMFDPNQGTAMFDESQQGAFVSACKAFVRTEYGELKDGGGLWRFL